MNLLFEIGINVTSFIAKFRLIVFHFPFVRASWAFVASSFQLTRQLAGPELNSTALRNSFQCGACCAGCRLSMGKAYPGAHD
jgi:hypothetical protein